LNRASGDPGKNEKKVPRKKNTQSSIKTSDKFKEKAEIPEIERARLGPASKGWSEKAWTKKKRETKERRRGGESPPKEFGKPTPVKGGNPFTRM